MRHTLAVLVENRPGVLAHISGLISRRGFNIASIAASSTEESDITRISLVVEVKNSEELEQMVAQLNKLVEVLKVVNLTDVDHIDRELGLIKVRASAENRGEISNVVDIFRAKIVDVHPESMVMEICGEVSKVEAFCNLMAKYGIIEIIRTGEIFLSRLPAAESDSIKGKND